MSRPKKTNKRQKALRFRNADCSLRGVMAHKIYIADDEKNILELLKNFLQSDGYEVSAFETGDALLSAFENEPSDLVILDIMMPGRDGTECVKELRKVSSVPIILLTAKDGELDYVNGIMSGSDDYLTKPFRPTMLLMKVKALLRRSEMSGGKKNKGKVLKYADLTYSEDEHSVVADKTAVALTKTEMSMLAFMMDEPQKAHSRDRLLDEIWGFGEGIETRAIDETVRRTRKKLAAAKSVVTIETVWGYGYKLSVTEKDK